jgi:hypothetical protein
MIRRFLDETMSQNDPIAFDFDFDECTTAQNSFEDFVV